MTNDDQQVADTMRRLAEMAQAAPRPGRARRGGVPSGVEHDLQLAGTHANVAAVPAAGRAAFAKRVVMRLNQLTLVPQTAYNRSMIEAAAKLNYQVEVTLREELASAREELDELRAQVDRLEFEAKAVRADTGVELRATVSSVERMRQDLGRLVGDFRKTGLAPDTASVAPVLDTLEAQRDRIYSDFEARFRGSETEIKSRLMPYFDYVLPLRTTGAPVVDVGPGRGEWLDLLREYEVPAFGIDTNEYFVQEAEARGLDVRHGDGVAALAAVEHESVAAVTSFQVIEHLALDQLEALIRAAFDAVRPGGVVILETPNPTNLRVGASTFLRDPTHVRPLHPDLVTFLIEQTGFVGVEIRYMNPSPEYANEVLLPSGPGTSALRGQVEDVRWALYGPQDYAVIGRKPAPAA